MASDYTGSRRNSNTQILQELEAFSESLYQSHVSTTRRTASLALPRSAVPPISATDHDTANDKDSSVLNPKPRSRRMSLSPWRSRPNLDTDEKGKGKDITPKESNTRWTDHEPAEKKGGIWTWKPIRALTHITMQKLSCLFSVEVVTVQNLPASMNGLRLSVCVRKKENKEGSVQTMPSRVSQGAADFEETLFIRCHVYYSSGNGKQKFEPRPFFIYVVAVDAEELDFGRNAVDLSSMIQESVEKSLTGARVKQWDTTFNLSGKAKGSELVLKLGFQIMEKDGGIGIYSQVQGQKSGNNKSKSYSPSVARKQSKMSFSVPSPRMSSRGTPSQNNLQGIDDLNLDEPAAPPAPAPVPETKIDENENENELDFDIVDKGVEIQDKEEEEDEEEESSDKRSVSSEVVKEVIDQDQSHVTRMTELDSIAQQIKALESMMGEKNETKTDEEVLDEDEDKVTRDFLQMLEEAEAIDDEIPPMNEVNSEETESEVFLPDLGKGLGCVIQTRNGGYLAAMNPLDIIVNRKDIPKLAMQMSKPLILQSKNTGFEVFQKMAGIGVEELTSEVFSLMPMDDLNGKTAEQIAFEGIASAIIQGRNKEGASSSAARTIAAVKTMVNAINSGRKERVSTGIWNVSEEPLPVDEILAFSMQKIESMAVEGLKIQADIAEEDAPFDVSPLNAKTSPLASSTLIEDWKKVDKYQETITISVVVQLRDPMRQYEAVGGPMVALIHANNEEAGYKVTSMQVGGIKGSKNVWDNGKQRLTALQWLVAYGMGKKGKGPTSKDVDLLWSISSRVMADMWLKPIRNPDVKFNK